MTMLGTLLVTITIGLFAAIGLAGMLLGAAFVTVPWRHRSFRLGNVAMTGAGALSMVAGLAGLAPVEQVLGGLMMVLFGTGASLPDTQRALAPVVRS
jgi:hypothetical protein